MAEPNTFGGLRTRKRCAERLAQLEAQLTQRLNAWGDDGRITVLTLTYCRRADLFYGTSLLFKTLRIGFPTARVLVVENASLPTHRPEIQRLAGDCQCDFLQIDAPSIEHEDFLEIALSAVAASVRADGPLVFLDPDICFWETCEGFQFDGPLAGKFDRAYEVEGVKTLSMPRIHTSFMWIPSARRLWDEIERCRTYHYDFYPFASYSVKIAGHWCRFDTAASLYAVLSDRVSFFGDAHLRCYDHLYCGCHIDWLEPVLDKHSLATMKAIHAHARNGNLEALRGAGKLQAEAWRQAAQQRFSRDKPVFSEGTAYERATT